MVGIEDLVIIGRYVEIDDGFIKGRNMCFGIDVEMVKEMNVIFVGSYGDMVFFGSRNGREVVFVGVLFELSVN